MGNKIDDLISTVVARLEKAGYAAKSIENFKYAWKKLSSYAEGQGRDSLDENLAKSYLAELDNAKSESAKGIGRRCVKILCMEAGLDVASLFPDKREKKQLRYVVPTRFESAYEEFLEHERLRKPLSADIRSEEYAARRFLDFLDDRIGNLEDLKLQDIDDFFASLTETCSPNGTSHFRTGVKRLVAFLVAHMALDESLLSFYPSFKSPEAGLPTFLAEEEVAQMLAAAKDSWINPKRTLALVALFVQYMPRNASLRNMRVGDIDWADNTIVVRSSKNGKSARFPLTESMRYILLDYMRSERPDAAYDNLFLTTKYPFVPVKDSSSISRVINRVAKKAGISVEGRRMGSHVLRRSGATMLMNADVEYPVLSDILIHTMHGKSCSGVTMAYLKVDISRLRPVALEVPPHAV